MNRHGGVLLPLIQDHHGHDDRDNDQEDDREDEANPSLFACGASRVDSFVSEPKTVKHV